GVGLWFGGCAAVSRSPVCTCETPKPSGDSAQVPNLYDVQRQIAEYIDSGRYEMDVARVAGEAQAYMEERAAVVTRPAIVLDIDETSLSNWPAYRANGWGRALNGECHLPEGPAVYALGNGWQSARV